MPRSVAFICAAGAIAVLPLVFTDAYWRTNLIVCALNVMLAIGLDFVLGYAGQLNLGQSGFYAIGAYASTLLITRLGVPFWIAFVIAVVCSCIAGLALSLFAMRLRGHYLAIASLGFAVIIYQVLVNWISLTQGPLGIYAIPPPPALALPGLPTIDFHDLGHLFYLVAGSALLSYWLLDQLVRSPIGETLTAIREDEVSAARSASIAGRGRCSLSGPGPRSPARPAVFTRPSSARWCRMRSCSPNPSRSWPWWWSAEWAR